MWNTMDLGRYSDDKDIVLVKARLAGRNQRRFSVKHREPASFKPLRGIGFRKAEARIRFADYVVRRCDIDEFQNN
jgi:hypothetical protein